MLLTILVCSMQLMTHFCCSRSVWYMACLNFLFELTLVLQYNFILYWLVIHAYLGDEIKNDFWKNFFMYVVHINPSVSILILAKTTGLRVIRAHWVVLIPVHLCYDYVNYFATLYILKKPLYWFVTWEGIDSILICIVILLWQCLCWTLTADKFYPEVKATSKSKKSPKTKSK